MDRIIPRLIILLLYLIATWCWHLFIVFMGTLRIFTRSPQLVSAQVRYFLMKSQMERYFKKNAHLDRIKYYLLNCSIGNWYILYQISKNINPRLFAEFITVLAETINPDPTIENEEPEIYFSSEVCIATILNIFKNQN